MSIAIRALTSDNDDEIRKCLEILKTTTADTYFMHEAVNFLINSIEYGSFIETIQTISLASGLHGISFFLLIKYI